MRALILLGLVVTSGAASAAERGYSVQDFDRIRVEGPYDVSVRVGPPATVRAQGRQIDLDRLSVEAAGGTLLIKPDRSGWGGWPGAKSEEKVVVIVATRTLRAATMVGSGTIAVDRMRASSVQLGIAGSGDIGVGAIDADSVALSVIGSGNLKVAGRAKQARVNIQGSGDVDAAALEVQDATVTVAGSGDLKLAASRSAKIDSAGSGDIAVTGTAACTVNRAGSGDVTCGRGG